MNGQLEMIFQKVFFCHNILTLIGMKQVEDKIVHRIDI